MSAVRQRRWVELAFLVVVVPVAVVVALMWAHDEPSSKFPTVSTTVNNA